MNEIHSKVTMVRRMVRRQLKESPDSRIIVFANFRDTVDEISRVLTDVEMQFHSDLWAKPAEMGLPE